MSDVEPQNPEIPLHPEEMKGNFDLRVGKCISLQGSGRITPAGLVTAGITVAIMTLALGFLMPRRRR